MTASLVLRGPAVVCYRHYGLCLQSSRVLPDLPLAAPAKPSDLRLHWSGDDGQPAVPSQDWTPVTHPTLPPGKSMSVWTGDQTGGEFFQVRYQFSPGALVLTLSPDHRDLWVSPPDGLAAEDVQAQLLGPVLGWVLRRRGSLCLHASVVSFGGRAVAFIGAKRSGKSTLAVACRAAGGRILSDDLLVLTQRDGSFLAQPGYRYARLRPDAAQALCENPDSLSPVYVGGARRRLDLPATEAETVGSGGEGVPLVCLYLLQRRQPHPITPQAVPTVSQEALPWLAANTYAGFALAPEQRPAEFQALAELVRRVPVRKLTRMNDLSALPAVCEAVRADLATIPEAA